MRVTFFLKDVKAKKRTPLFARVLINGKPFLKYYLPITIEPKHWNQKEQQFRRTLSGFAASNHLLRGWLADMEEVYRDYVATKKEEPSKNVLKDLFDAKIKPDTVVANSENSFISYFENFIAQSKEGIRLNPNGKPVTSGTINTYEGTLNFIKLYQKTIKRPVDFDTIDLDFYYGFTEYLSKKQLQSTNSIGKHIKNLKAILNDATERGVNKNLAYKSKLFKRVSEKTDSIYLTENEIAALARIDLTNRKGHEQVRDLFIVGCYTGLRFSDLSKLKAEHIEDGFIEIVQQKTSNPVTIPVHPEVQRILDKYYGELPKAITNQKTNEYLKEIADIPELQETQSKTITKAGTGITKSLKKHKLITTHTARRSFATNNYKNGVPAITIMAITGHKTEKAFLSYIKVTPKEHAKILQLNWQKSTRVKQGFDL